MRKYIHHLLFVLAVAVSAVSCNKEPGSVPAGVSPDGRVPIVFKSGWSLDAGVSTRSTEITANNAGQTLQSLYVTAVTGTQNNIVSGFQNVSFSRDNSGNYTASDRYWPAEPSNSNDRYRFFATNSSTGFSRVSSGTNAGNFSLSVSLNGNDSDPDILVGYLGNVSYNQVNMISMQHVLAQIGSITVNAPQGYDVIGFKLWFNPIYSGTYTFSRSAGTWSWTDRGNGGGNYYLIGSSNSGQAIAAGAGYSSGDKNMFLVPNGSYRLYASYQISKGAYTSPIISVRCDVNIQEGKQNNITAAVIEGGAGTSEIQFSVDIADWVNNNINASFVVNN